METQKETSAHNALKKQAKILLLDMGYDSSEISEEYRLKVNGDKGFIIDVVGISKKGKTAIECGHTDAIKAASLSLFFDKVILLPFNVEIMSPEIQNEIIKNSDIIKNLNEKIAIYELDNKKLKEKIKRYEDKINVEKDLENFATYLFLAMKEGSEYNIYFNNLGNMYPQNSYQMENYYTQLKLAALRDFIKQIENSKGSTEELASELNKISVNEKQKFQDNLNKLLEKTYNLKNP